MNMRDTILINKELLKRELQFLEEQIKQARLVELDEIISEKGLSFEEVKELLNK